MIQRCDNRSSLPLGASHRASLPWSAAVCIALMLLCAPFAAATDLSVTAANVLADPGAQFYDGTAGATITAGQTVYVDPSDNRLKLADADGVADAATVRGIALQGASANQPLKVQTGGSINPGATVTVGTIYVQSANAGGIAPVGDLGAGHRVSILGVGTAANKILLILRNSGVAVPGGG